MLPDFYQYHKKEKRVNYMDFKFGDKLYFSSPKTNGETKPCVFLRDWNGVANVVFQDDEHSYYVGYEFLSKTNNLADVEIATVRTRSEKRKFILDKAVEHIKNNIPFLFISNIEDIFTVIQLIKVHYEDKYSERIDKTNLNNCYVISVPDIKRSEIYDICELFINQFGVKTLIFDYIRNTNPINFVDNSSGFTSEFLYIGRKFGVNIVSARQAFKN